MGARSALSAEIEKNVPSAHSVRAFLVAIASYLAALTANSPVGAGILNTAELYTASAIVTGQDPIRHKEAFAECFRQVVVKASGDPRLHDDPRIASGTLNISDYVERVDLVDRLGGRQIHDEQGSRDRPFELTVRFKKKGVDKTLRELGREPWPLPRARLILLVSVRLHEAQYVLASDALNGAGMPEAIAAAGGRFGIEVALPSKADLSKVGTNVNLVETNRSGFLASNPFPRTETVIGTLVWSDTHHGWDSHWRLAGAPGQTWSGTGTNFDEAYRIAIGGAVAFLSGHPLPSSVMVR